MFLLSKQSWYAKRVSETTMDFASYNAVVRPDSRGLGQSLSPASDNVFIRLVTSFATEAAAIRAVRQRPHSVTTSCGRGGTYLALMTT